MKMKDLLLAVITAVVLAMFVGGCTDDPGKGNEQDTTENNNNNNETGKIWDWTADTTWYTNNKEKTEFTITTAEQLAGLTKLTKYDFNNQVIKLGADIFLNDTTKWIRAVKYFGSII